VRSVYHTGEIGVQTRAGVREMAKRVGGGIHDFIPPAAEEFLASQPMLIVSSVDRVGHVWASLLVGEPGFVRVIDERTALIDAVAVPGDPLAPLLTGDVNNLSARFELGILAIELETRRRMRLNGTAEMTAEGALLVRAHEVYANCPKYIQAREIRVTSPDETDAPEATTAAILSPKQQEWIAHTDTFFIGTAASNGRSDASHRGGQPGFVRVLNPTTLEWPDYSGNMMFNTLGNITTNPNAGLLFLDFVDGDTLQLTGKAKVVWGSERAAIYPGAERVVEFHLEQAIQITHANPLRFRFLNYSRFNPH
jgi:uncharacterized protein